MTTYQHVDTGVKVEMLSDVAGIVNYRNPFGDNLNIASTTFHEHWRPCDAAPVEVVPVEPARALYALMPAEHATVLAALRDYQNYLTIHGSPPFNVADIATNGGIVVPLSADDIDNLCESLNHSGADLHEVFEVLGADAGDPYVAAAHEHDLVQGDHVTIDGATLVSHGSDGAHVACWLFVSNEEAAGVDEESDHG